MLFTPPLRILRLSNSAVCRFGIDYMIWSDAWATAFGVAAIAFACTIYYTAKAWFGHRERMAQINQGKGP